MLTLTCEHCGVTFQRKQRWNPRHFCSRHCANSRKKGDTAFHFWKRVEKTDTCWLWMGSRVKYGYGSIRTKGRSRLAHRVSWSLHFGEPPDDLDVCHKCDNPSCVRPDHLFLGTHADNMDDKARKLRGTNKLSVDDVLTVRRSRVSSTVMAAEIGVSAATIRQIRSMRTWRHVDAQ